MALKFIAFKFLSQVVHVQPTLSKSDLSCVLHNSECDVKCKNCEILIFFYPVFCVHFCSLIEKITKGKKPPVSLLEHIYGLTDFLD